MFRAGAGGGNSDVQWCFSQVKGAIDDDVAEGESMCWSMNSCCPALSDWHPVHACCEVSFNDTATRSVCAVYADHDKF